MERYADSIYSDESQANQLIASVVKTSTVVRPLANSAAEYSLHDDYASNDSPRAQLYELPDMPVTQSQAPGVLCKSTGQLSASWQSRAEQYSAVDQGAGNGSTNKGQFTMIVPSVVDRDPTGNSPVNPVVFLDASQRTKATDNAQMPSPTPTPPMASPRGRQRKTNRHRKQRSPSLQSDDSFAGPLPLDLQRKRHIATSKALNLPFSQLEESADSYFDDTRPEEDELSTSSIPRLSGIRSHSGRIMVPSSVSAHSQDEDDSFMEQQAQVERSYDSDDEFEMQRQIELPSSAEAQTKMAALLENSPLQDMHPLPPAADHADPHPPFPDATQTDTDVSEPPHQTRASTGTSGARSITSHLEPHKLRRYQAYINRQAGNSSHEPRFPAPATTAYDSGETQLDPATSALAPTGLLVQNNTRSPTPPPPFLAGQGEETQITASANLPATGHTTSPSNTSRTSQFVTPAEVLYEETYPSTSSNNPPTDERIDRELKQSPVRRSMVKRQGFFSNLANYDSEVPDSQSDSLPNPTLSPVMPSPNPTPPQHAKTNKSPTKSAPKSPWKSTAKPAGPANTSGEIIPDSVSYERDRAEEEDIREVLEEVTRSPEKQEEEESSEEESQPLAQVIASRKSTAPTANNGKRGRGLSQTLMPPPPKKEKADATPNTKATKSREISKATPSTSAPQAEESPKVTRKSTREKASASKTKGKGKAKGKKAVTPKPKTPIRDEGDTEEDEGAESDGTKDTITDEQRTEVADEDEGVDADDSLPTPGTSSRKRKRVVQASTRSIRSSAQAGNSIVKKLTRASTTTPVTRPTKRIKVESLTEMKKSGATRVLALWRGDARWYCGTVFSETAPGKYWVHFDDDYQDTVIIDNLRVLDFQPQDSVTYINGDGDNSGDGAKIVKMSCTTPGEETVVIECDGARCEVEVGKLKVVWKTVKREWEGRKLEAWQIEPYEKPAKVSTPSGQSNQNSHGTIGANKDRYFANTGFVVSLMGGDDLPERRRELSDLIKVHGGTIVTDWGEIFSIQGTCQLQGKRWTWTEEDVKYLKNGKLSGKFEKVFLLANASSQKPKFLVALALGIPCVDVRWLEECVEENKRLSWQNYLLPAATSEQLGVQMSQLVDYAWGDSIYDMQDIMDNKAAVKVFRGMRILCVSPAFIEPKKGSTAEILDPDKVMIPRIILSMGASAVEAVSSLTYANGQHFEEDYDYIVIEPRTYEDITARVKQFKNWVPFTWVKECLITSRLLPVVYDPQDLVET